ncbi:MAG: chorismate mutase [Planctomycetes bacterium]|nr:chorismate mutase [Planctomycetota bacterium]
MDSAEEIAEATVLLLKTLIEANKIAPEDLASAFFSMTPDLHATFPAKAARDKLDWAHVPLFCSQELDIEGGLDRCIRVLLHWNTDKPQRDIFHAYLRKAEKLRPDLFGSERTPGA